MHSHQGNVPHQPLAIFGLLYGAFIWGVIWYPYRLLATSGIDGLQASLLTYGVALLLAILFSFRDLINFFPLPKGMMKLAIAAGWTNIAYILAIIDGEVVRVMLLFFLSPVWTLILAHYCLKERTTVQGIVVIVLALLGAFIMLYDPDKQGVWWQQLPLPHGKAEWWALSAGIGFSSSNVITRHSVQLSLAHKSFAVWLGVVVMAVLFMLFLPVQKMNLLNITTDTSLLVLLIAFLLITVTLFVQYGVTKVPATNAAVIFLFELVVAAIAAYYLAGEVLSWNEWLGGGFIMFASLLSVRSTTHTQGIAA